MAHEIETHDTAVFGLNKPAWHGLGKLFPGLFSPLRVYAEGVGAREILEVPVLTADGLSFGDSKGLVAVTTDGTRVPLSVVSKGYGLIPDMEFFKILEQTYDGRAVVETAGTLRNGKRIWALVRGSEFEVTAGDIVKGYDLWVNRHDGSGCFEMHRTAVRVVCANTWRMAIGSGQNRVFGVRHNRNAIQSAHSAARAIERANEAQAVREQELRRLAEKNITTDTAVTVFRSLFETESAEGGKEEISDRAEKHVERLVSLFREGTGTNGRTAWDAFNAVTEYVDHSRKVVVRGGRDKAEARFENAVLGTGDDMKAAAYDALLSI